jgi:cellulose synthase/poly-beta-1,6-N-acetylglucosamine synthase-like glycosyltransferase|tara:strand:- start:652 stop:1083 length:432 start_codon:yes stop_codon:yes gene_type:complete
MYWATEYWIPELVRRGELQEYQFALMIDDDVPLPPDLHVPNNTLNRNPAIKACAYVIQAATEDGKPNNLVSVQDLEYKMAGFIKQFQFTGGTTVCCHGAIALWRRDVLGSKILWDHDTVFHGEDLYMGLLLHRMRANYGIMVR